jgi:hypothetical protein
MGGSEKEFKFKNDIEENTTFDSYTDDPQLKEALDWTDGVITYEDDVEIPALTLRVIFIGYFFINKVPLLEFFCV